MRTTLVALLVVVVATPAYSKSGDGAEQLTPQLPKIGWISEEMPAQFCANVSAWNRVIDLVKLEYKDVKNFERLRNSDPAKAFAYWNDSKRISDELQTTRRQLCGQIAGGTPVLVINTMLDDMNERIALVKTPDGRQGIVGENLIEFY